MKPRTLLALLAALAFVVKLYCAATTFGTADVTLFWEFGRMIHSRGLVGMYQATELFNHTPLIGWFSEGAYLLANWIGDGTAFNFLLRLPAIVADLVATAALIWLREKTGRPSYWAIGLFAVSPVSFMVSGFHGNVDSLMVMGLVLAAVACAVERPVWSGLFLGLSCNIKVVPLFLIPAFFFFWWHRKAALRFSIPAAATVLIGWSVPLLFVPGIFIKNVIGYSSYWGFWGITYGLRLTGIPSLQEVGFTDQTMPQRVIIMILKAIVVCSVLYVAWRRRGTEPMGIFQTLALSWGIFFVFAPGFGAQYLVWLAPFFLVAAEAWYAALTIASSVALIIYYTASCDGKIPWNVALNSQRGGIVAMPWLVSAWLVLAVFLLRQMQVFIPLAGRKVTDQDALEVVPEG